VRRLAILILARSLAAFLAVQVADTPLFCPDERPVEGFANASHQAPASGDFHTTPESSTSDPASCFCPCHLTFDYESSVAVVASTEPSEKVSDSTPTDPAAPLHSLDHPPQNLG
jgi:hypothetical protein